MGSTNSNNQPYDKILSLINSSRFNEAFLLLKTHFARSPYLKNDLQGLQNLESTYRYMLDYLAEGHQDPSQNEVIGQIRDGLLRANDQLLRATRLLDSPHQYSSIRRMMLLKNYNLSYFIDNFIKALKTDSEASEERNFSVSSSQILALDELFKYIWTLNDSASDDYDILNEAIENSELPGYFKVMITSALILGNIEYFNEPAFEILLDLYNSDSIDVKARAIIGIVLVSVLHPRRVSENIHLRSKLMMLGGDPDFNKLINFVLTDLIRTYDTKRIDDKMRNEVIPGLMKMKPEFLDKMKNMAAESEDFLSGENPGWEEFLEESEIGKKIQEINDMQLEGADVMVTAFSQLKNFPFFSLISNWFSPFIPGREDFANIGMDTDEFAQGALSVLMCDSDIHSFLLSLSAMPQQNKTMMMENMQNQMKEAKEALSDSIGAESEEKVLSKKINYALRDLYRFFKFYRKKDEFSDPFGSPFLAGNIKPLVPILNISSDTIRLIAEFYFKNKYYEEALGFFTLLDNLQPGDYNIWEKIGFCYDRIHRYSEAVEWYKKAEIVNPENPWLIRQMAVSLKNSGQPIEALDYYKKALVKEPDNYHLIMSAAQCLLDAGQPKEALSYFYHAHYLKPEKINVQRAIAWAELMAGNYEKSSNLYLKLCESEKAEAQDFLNAGHCALASGNFKTALSSYKAFVNKNPDRDIKNLLISFRDDSEAMKKLGIKTSDLRLIVDKIRYDGL